MDTRRGSSRIVLIATIILFIGVGQASADHLFSTFGPGDSYSSNLGWPVGLYNYSQGMQFSFAGSQPYLLDSIALATRLVSGDNQLNVSLMNDVGGFPGSPIESFSFVNQMTSGAASILEGTSISHPLLTPATDYWLVASATSSTHATWQVSQPQISGLRAWSTDGVTWDTGTQTLGAFRVDGTSVVPLPGAIMLGSIGALLVGWLRRRKSL